MLNETNLSAIDLNLLVLFDVVLEERHVGRAAARLNLSPSAVSHGLGRLRRLLHDPVFLRNPKGVVPTARATLLAEPIAEILARVKRVMASAEPFDPATATRRFTIGASDGISAVILPPLLTATARAAPGIDLGVRDLLPPFETALAELDARKIDLAIVPLPDQIPARFVSRPIYDEDFVIAMRIGHPLGAAPTLARYCAAQHLVVSSSGDPRGYVDDVLAQHGFSRRVALTVPNFMLALAIVADTDLVSALPKRVVRMHGTRLGIATTDPPVPLRLFQVRAIAPEVAMMDAGLAWLLDLLEQTSQVEIIPRAARPARGRRGRRA